MPQDSELQPISAFLMYKKKLNKNKQNGKRKKSKQTVPKENSLKTIKKQKSVKKVSKVKKIVERQPEKPPTLVAVDSKVTLKSQIQNGTAKETQTEGNLAGSKQHMLSEDESSLDKKKNKIKINNRDIKSPSIIDDPVSEAVALFKWMIAPLKPEAFFEMYWEQKPVHIKRSSENYYKHILNSSSLDKMIRNNPLYYTKNVDVVSYENGVKEVYNQEGRATPSALWDYYSNGCSIRILNPQTYNQKVHLLIATLQEYFGTMVGANVYLTPCGSQGFAPHYDDIEAFVVQLEGRKHWKLYQPKDSDVLARYSSGNFKREEIGEPFMELTLQAGEVLYFPRGTIHEGCTDEESHSLHITVSVYQQTSYADLLEHILPNALKKAAENDVNFRRGLPLNYLKNFGAVTNSKDRNSMMMKNVQDLMQCLSKYIDVDSAADQLGRKFMRDSMPPVLAKSETERTVKADGPYLKEGQVNNRVEINLDTRVRLLRYYCIRLIVEDGSTPKLYYNTENAPVYHGEEEQWLELDPTMIPVIQVLQNTYPNYIEIDELPMEDIAVKMQLISDLWEHGLLVTEQPLEILD